MSAGVIQKYWSLSPHCIGSLSFWLHESRCGCVSLLVESFDTLSPEGVGKMDKGCMLFTSCKRISGVQQLVHLASLLAFK